MVQKGLLLPGPRAQVPVSAVSASWVTGCSGIRLPHSGSPLTFPVWLREGGWWGLEKPDCLAFVFLAALSVREGAPRLCDLSEETLGFAGGQTLRLLSGMSLVP